MQRSAANVACDNLNRSTKAIATLHAFLELGLTFKALVFADADTVSATENLGQDMRPSSGRDCRIPDPAASITCRPFHSLLPAWKALVRHIITLCTPEFQYRLLISAQPALDISEEVA